MNLIYKILVILALTHQFTLAATAPLKVIRGSDVLSAKTIETSVEGQKGMVVIFLSATCPCSDSHLNELKALAAAYPEFSFVGAHANSNESPEPTKAYFERAKLPFPVIQDSGAKLADQLKAVKTPHAFLIGTDGTLLFRGGVSSSHEAETADRMYLREALADVQAGRSVKTKEARLGLRDHQGKVKMNSRLIMLIGFLALVGCAEPKYFSAPQVLMNEKGSVPTCQAKLPSGECVNLVWEKAPGGTDASFLIKMFRPNLADGSPVLLDPQGTVAVKLWMPSMGHGAPPVIVNKIDVGTYRAANIYFTMRGNWEIHIQVKDGNELKAEAILPFSL